MNTSYDASNTNIKRAEKFILKTVLHHWNDIYMLGDIPFWVAKRNGGVICSFPNDLMGLVHSYFFDYVAVEIKRHNLGRDIMLEFVTDYYYLIIIPLDEDKFVVTIPLATQKPSPMPFNYIRQFAVKKESSRLVNLIAHTLVQTVGHAKSFAGLIKSAYNGGSFDEVKIYRHRPNMEDEKQEDIELRCAEQMNAQSDVRFYNQSLYLERQLKTAIINGDELSFAQHFDSRIDKGLGQISLDPVRQQKYRAVIVINAFTNAAIEGGLDPQLAFNLSDRYCQEMDELSSVSTVQSIMRAAGLDFCGRIREIHGKQEYSVEVSLCIKYIYGHIYEKVNAADLDVVARMNRKTLGIKFKKETGMSVPEFIINEKLKEACFLLKTTDMELGEISYLLCFSSQSHFTARFKEKYGLTPKSYRSSAEINKMI